MKLGKQELINKVNEKVTDVDLAIELIEDITDSFEGEDMSGITSELEMTKQALEDLKIKYKERFLTAIEETVENNEESDNNEELTEEEVIDVEEI